MDFYFYILLSRKVATRMNGSGMDTAVCRAKTPEDAVAQLLPEMRPLVAGVMKYGSMRRCYPNPDGILKECAI